MEEVAIMVPSIVNNDELSDETESINLDLHVSDTEDSTESLKKCESEIIEQTESEEDILNKYIDDSASVNAPKDEETKEKNPKPILPNGSLNKDFSNKDSLSKDSLNKQSETHKKCNGQLSPLVDEQEESDDLDVTLTNINDDDLKDEKEEDRKEEEEEEKTENNTATKEDEKVEKIVEEEQKEEKDEEASSKECEKINEESEKSSEECGKSSEECGKSSEECEKSSEESEKSSEKPEKSSEECTQNSDEPETNDSENCSDEKTDSDEKMEVEDTDSLCETTKTISDKSESDLTDDTAAKDSESKGEESEFNDDLLCVMDEKTVEEANNKDENSCSASEKEDESKENEESNNEENKDDEEMEENSESQAELDIDSSECAMDIEESDIGGVVYTDQDRESRLSRTCSIDDKIETDKDANKENELKINDIVVTSPGKDVEPDTVSKGLTNGVAEEDIKEDDGTEDEQQDADSQKKSTKRQLSDSSVEGESVKKIRLETEEIEKVPVKRAIVLLDSFKKFMLDKKLKNLTRLELEELCMQKMCECIVNKSEIGELRQKIMIQEQAIDTWKKEATVVTKQTRDLKIVHERLMADLKVMKEQTGKPLVPVKITRSVGLQAIIENPTRVRTTPLVNGTSSVAQRSPVVNNSPINKNVSSPQNRQPAKPKPPPQRVTTNNSRPLQPITQKDNVNNAAKPRQTVASPQQQNKKSADPKAVIDLTDEDEKNQNAKQATNTASPTVRILNKQNLNIATKPVVSTPNSQASKIMFVSPNVLSRNSTVMVKMNSNGLMSSPNGITTISNGQVSVVTTPVVRTVSQVRVPVTSVSAVRSTPTPKTPYKHPAPLPAAPNYSPLMGKKPIPPKPQLNLTRSSCGTGIVLQWKMPYKLDAYENIVSYQLYAYQETKSPPKTDNWGKIGDVKALELPMAVTLTQFAVGNRYFFAVRAVDEKKRLGPFSEPENILL